MKIIKKMSLPEPSYEEERYDAGMYEENIFDGEAVYVDLYLYYVFRLVDKKYLGKVDEEGELVRVK